MTTPKRRMFDQAVEDAIEQAFWRFDARRKGLALDIGGPQSERDAFKAEARVLAYGAFPIPESDERRMRWN